MVIASKMGLRRLHHIGIRVPIMKYVRGVQKNSCAGINLKTLQLYNAHGMLGVRKALKNLEIAKMMNGSIVVKVSQIQLITG